jgi:hypothetical protein
MQLLLLLPACRHSTTKGIIASPGVLRAVVQVLRWLLVLLLLRLLLCTSWVAVWTHPTTPTAATAARPHV